MLAESHYENYSITFCVSSLTITSILLILPFGYSLLFIIKPSLWQYAKATSSIFYVKFDFAYYSPTGAV